MAPRPEAERSDIAESKGDLHSLSDMPVNNEGTDQKEKREETVPPDGGWGWMVLLGTMTVNFVMIGHGKSFGVYFKTLMDEFDASPSRVAWLQSLQISIFSFISPLASVLSQLLGPRKVALFGGLMAFLGLTVSSFAPSLEYLYISYGVVQGIAVTCTFTPGITMIAKYFYKRRGFANGLTMSGNALGGIIIPLVVNKLISEYSLRGCFLIMGSILLHACVGSMLWQPVEWHQIPTNKESAPMLGENQQELIQSDESSGEDTLCPDPSYEISHKEKIFIEHYEPTFSDSLVDCSLNVKSSVPEICHERKDSIMYASGPNLYCNESSVQKASNKVIRGGSSPHLADISKSNERTYGSSVSTESLPIMFRLTPKLRTHCSRTSSFIYLSSYSFGPTVGAVLTKEHFTSIESNESKDVVKDLNVSQAPKKWSFKPCLRKIPIDKSIFQKSRFYIMTVSLFFHALGYPGTQIFLPYRATNLGLSEAQAASLLSVMAFTDLIGRICCAWISDYNFCPRKYWFIGGMFMSGVFGLSLPFYKTYATLLVGAASFGFFCGAYIGLVVVLFADAYTSEKVALAYSISTVSGGFMALGGPPLMGYVLETTGSYLTCQAIMSSAQFAGAVIWLAEPWAVRWEKRREEEMENPKSPEEQQLV